MCAASPAVEPSQAEQMTFLASREPLVAVGVDEDEEKEEEEEDGTRLMRMTRYRLKQMPLSRDGMFGTRFSVQSQSSRGTSFPAETRQLGSAFLFEAMGC